MAVAEKEFDCIWIGLRHKLHTWRWSMGVPSLSYDEKDDIWADGQPNNYNGAQHCATIMTTTGGSYDRSFEQLKTWSEAQAYCRTHHDDLASVTSEAVLLDLEARLISAGVYWAWTGLYRDPWSTWSDSTNTSFDNWGTRPTIYPTDDHCGCLKPDTGKWEERYCTAGCKFFCYDVRHQTVLKVKLLSGADLKNMEIQQQVMDQMKNTLESVKGASFTIRWRKTPMLEEPAPEQTSKCVDEH
ncbi:uncharacterized protein [Eucyclogobius newberryi]|uniref:uncharacterized protein n=1 Tax=Eucyclogobius newberryi TaxID=166745 RepID=UPI003B5A0D3D